PTIEELYTLVNLMARSGYATGTPVSHASVFLGAKELGRNNLSQHDVVAMGSLSRDGFLPARFSQQAFSFLHKNVEVKPQSLIDKAKGWMAGDYLSQ
ncbi:cellulose biosynthesis cyclic di-GMP-binding regulatory protein BcsB, partial [Salmonella enterica]|uniref:cellulose biosynthesis cyclic di-GMP-binding regulatory protein BcsB n=1 Tax=Salmonella enterica TaxID=28901 RepID=UPI003C6E44D9